MDDKDKVGSGTDERLHDKTIIAIGPNVRGYAGAPGAELPPPPSDEEVRRIAEKLGAPIFFKRETTSDSE